MIENRAFALTEDEIEKSRVKVDILTDGKTVTFRPWIPRGYEFPEVPNTEKTKIQEGEQLEIGSAIGPAIGLKESVAGIEELRGKIIGTDEEGFGLMLTGKGDTLRFRMTPKPPWNDWHLPFTLPRPLLEIIAQTLQHEAAYNPDIRQSVCAFELRIQRPDNNPVRAETAHLDFGGVPTTMYVFGDSPMTLEVIGKYKREMEGKRPRELDKRDDTTVTWLKPNMVYRVNHRWLHATPDDLFPKELDHDEPLRVWGRITFSKSSQN